MTFLYKVEPLLWNTKLKFRYFHLNHFYKATELKNEYFPLPYKITQYSSDYIKNTPTGKEWCVISDDDTYEELLYIPESFLTKEEFSNFLRKSIDIYSSNICSPFFESKKSIFGEYYTLGIEDKFLFKNFNSDIDWYKRKSLKEDFKLDKLPKLDAIDFTIAVNRWEINSEYIVKQIQEDCINKVARAKQKDESQEEIRKFLGEIV